MKWFKHLTDAMDDLFVKDLEKKFGDSGYAFWFKTLELIGNHGEDGKLIISWTNYNEKLHKRRTQVEQLLDFCSTSGKLLVKIEKEFVMLECKKFAEYSDNYTKYGKSLQRDLKDTTKQEEEEKKKEKKKKKEQTIPLVIIASHDTPEFKVAFFNFIQHRKELKKPLTPTAEKAALNKLYDVDVGTAVKMIQESISNGWQGIFPLKENNSKNNKKPTPHFFTPADLRMD